MRGVRRGRHLEEVRRQARGLELPQVLTLEVRRYLERMEQTTKDTWYLAPGVRAIPPLLPVLLGLPQCEAVTGQRLEHLEV